MDIKEEIANGRCTRDEAKQLVMKQVEKSIDDKLLPWFKVRIMAILIMCLLLPVIGVTAVLLAYAYSLVAR